MPDVDRWRAQCDPRDLPAIDALRSIVMAAGPELVESIKWNAPSFAQDGHDRITLGIGRKGGVRAVLHLGAARNEQHPPFDDRNGLATWPSPDRGVLTFADREAIERQRDALVDLFARWLGHGRDLAAK